MTVERNMFPLQHHHHQQAIHQLAQLQHPGAGLPLHQPLNQQQEHHQAYQLQKHQQHQFGKLEAATKVSKQHAPMSNVTVTLDNFKAKYSLFPQHLSCKFYNVSYLSPK